MTTEDKAQALVDKVRSEYPLVADFHVTSIALMRTIEQHDAFRQEVSDAMTYIKSLYPTLPIDRERFIIPKPKPDPLVEVFMEAQHLDADAALCLALHTREALAKRGLKIVETGEET